MMKNLPVLAEKISKYKNEKNKFHYAQHFFNFLHACCWRSNVRGQKSNYYSIQQYFTIFFYIKKSLIFLYIFFTISLHFFLCFISFDELIEKTLLSVFGYIYLHKWNFIYCEWTMRDFFPTYFICRLISLSLCTND